MQSLRRLIRDGQVWPAAKPSARVVQTDLCARFGVEQIDGALPCSGLPFGHIHEWSLEHQGSNQQKHLWFPPLFLISALLKNTLSSEKFISQITAKRKYIIAWVGRKCWPTPQMLQKIFSSPDNPLDLWCWKEFCVFLNPRDKQERLWCIAEILRHRSILAVVADGSGLNSKYMRRLQLAAREGNSLGIFNRAPWELTEPSIANSRWNVVPKTNDLKELNWQLSLLRAKGAIRAVPEEHKNEQTENQTNISLPLSWNLRWDETLRIDDSHTVGTISETAAAVSQQTITKFAS